jgi:hypothetical protein
MGRKCGAYGGGKRGAQGVGGGNLRERGRWGDPHVDGRIILTLSLLMSYISRTASLTYRLILYIW